MRIIKQLLTAILVLSVVSSSTFLPSAFGAERFGSSFFTSANSDDSGVTDEHNSDDSQEDFSGTSENRANGGMFTYAEPDLEDSNEEMTENAIVGSGQEKTEIAANDADGLIYEDDEVKITLASQKGVIPENASVSVKEILPTDDEHVEDYTAAVTGLEEELYKDGKSIAMLRMYDISILDENNSEIEPDGNVSVTIEYKDNKEIAEGEVGVAHIESSSSKEETAGITGGTIEDSEENTGKNTDNSSYENTDSGDASLNDTAENLDIEVLDTIVETVPEDTSVKLSFVTESFSYYIVFNGRDSANEPVNIGTYGWLRINNSRNQGTLNDDPDDQTIGWGVLTSQELAQIDNALNAGPTENAALKKLQGWGYARIVKFNLWELNPGNDVDSPYNSDYYTLKNTAEPEPQYFWVWSNTLTIDDYEMPGYEVLHTRAHRAWGTENGIPDEENDGLAGSYQVRGYRNAVISNEDGYKNSDLNVIDVYIRPKPAANGATKYVVRYVHADGTVSDGNERTLNQGETVTIRASDYCLDGEYYSGIAIPTGVNAVSVNQSTGVATITDNSQVPIAKVYVYYQADVIEDGTTQKDRIYDKTDDKYYTGEKGLYTDKSAEAVEGDNRQFVLNLESWYVDQAASVGMVLDASGSMAWTSDTPQVMEKTAEEWDAIFGTNYWTRGGVWSNTSQSSPLSSANVDKVLDKTLTDNTSMGYNGYHYYIYSERPTVSEYVALGYTDGTSYDTNFGRLPLGYVIKSRWNNSNNAGWYYVNSSGNTDRYLANTTGTGKSYDGKATKGPATFWLESTGNGRYKLMCEFCDGTKNSGGSTINVTSEVYEKRNKMFTKNEVLQDSLAQFATIVLGSSPVSELSLTRFSQNVQNGTSGVFQNTSYLPLLNWTNNSSEIVAALNQSVGSTGGKYKNDDGLNVYEYGLTGQTRTWTGVKAYIDYMKNRASANTSKYIVIFTDGKDTNGDADNPGTWGATGTQVQSLKNEGYTVITVLMKSKAMEASGEYESSKAFLTGIASPGLNGDSDYDPVVNGAYTNRLYFEADSDKPTDIVDIFRDIAIRISSGLTGYTVRDYIDPRFDVINEAGVVLTVLDENGHFTEGVDEQGREQFTTPDGKDAYLYYDEEKEMFYVELVDQSIPACGQNSPYVDPWTAQIRVRAKEDLIGGNKILTNGNIVSENQVFYPGHEGTSSAATEKYPSKTFPLTTVDPEIIGGTLEYTEDSIYLGEAVEPAEKLEWLLDTTSTDNIFTEYLKRFRAEYGNSSAPGTGGTYDALITKFLNGEIQELTIPYYYLDKVDDPASQTGTDAHRNDEIGKIKYTWTASNNKYQKYATDSTSDIEYILKVKYTPDTVAVRTGASSTLANQERRLRDDIGIVQTEYNVGTLSETVKPGESLTVVKRVYLSELENDASTSIDTDSTLNDKVYHYLQDAKGNTNGYKDYPMTVTGEGGFNKKLLLRVSKTDDALTSGNEVLATWFEVVNNQLTPLTSPQIVNVPQLIAQGADYVDLAYTLTDSTVSGTQKTFTIKDDNAGKAIIHIESGKIRIQKKILKSAIKQDLDANMTDAFTFSLLRKYTDPLDNSEKEETRTITLSVGGTGSAANTTYVSKAAVEALTADGDGYVLIDTNWNENLPFGEYTITETNAGAYTFDSVSAGTVSDDAGTTRDETKFEAGSVTAQDSKSITFYLDSVNSGKPAEATIDSTRTRLNAQIGIAVIKNVAKAKIKVTKKDSVDTTLLLKGAVFELYTDSSCTELVEGTKNAANEDATEFVSGADGTFIINNLDVGKTYYLYEKHAASGHYLLAGPIPVVVDDVGNVTIGTISDAELAGHVWVDSATTDVPYDIIVTNSPLYNLPSTGGPGNYIFTIIGVSISAVMVLMALREMKERAA